MTAKIGIIAQLRIDTRNEVWKLDRLICDWPLQVLTDRECDLFDRQRCDIGDVNRLARFEFAEEAPCAEAAMSRPLTQATLASPSPNGKYSRSSFAIPSAAKRKTFS